MRCLVLISFLTAFYGHQGAWAGGFQDAFEAALDYDATYQAARADLASVQQGVPLARAGLLPSVSFSMSDSRVEGARIVDNVLGTPVTSPLDYRAPVKSLNIRAPLFNREAWQKLSIAQTQVDFAQAVFATRKLELMDRLATAYLQRLQAAEGVQTARAQLQAAQSQSDLARRRLKLGEGTQPELLDAEAAVDTAKVLIADAQSQIDVAILSLRQITGMVTTERSDQQQIFDPEGRQWLLQAANTGPSLAELLNQAQASNPAIASRRHALELAQAAVARNGAGHYPRLDLVGSASSSRNESLSTLNQSADQRSWGLQLSVPIYSGGAVSASVKQALADQVKAEAELVAEQQSVALELTKLFYAVSSGGSKIAARQKTVGANRLALEGVQRGFATGFNTQADVVQTQSKLAQTRQDLIQVIHEYLLARMRLAIRAGAEPAQVVAEIDSLLK